MKLRPREIESTARAAARAAKLLYWAADGPALKRVGEPGAFDYVTERGQRVKDERTLRRIRALVIPPAWTEVRICPHAAGHIQAIGRDARGRKQYRYHARWRLLRDESKFCRLLGFAAALPRIRRRVEQDLSLPGLPRAKVLATVVRLLELTLIRVGNSEYARTNHSFGLTTLLDRHARFNNREVYFEFRGKSGVHHRVAVSDRRLARIVRRCQEIPGQLLFQYLDEDGKRHPISSGDVNDYLREVARGDYTAKDFRTWGATLLAAREFHGLPGASSMAELKRNVVRAIEGVARQLGNTVAVCRKCYIHFAIVNSYLDGSLSKTLILPKICEKNYVSRHTPEEAALLKWLQAGS